MNEAKLLNNLPLNGDLKPLSIGDENSPLELSTTKVRIQNLDVIGDFNIDGQDDNLLDRVGTNTYVKNTGDNFGIGTTTPLNDLHIESTGETKVRITGASSGRSLMYFYEGAGLRWTMGAYYDISDKFLISGDDGVGTDDFFSITQDGNVGIGTSSPTAKLEIENADTGSDLIAVLIDNDDPENWALDVQNGAGAYGIRYASTNGTVNPMLSLTGDGGVVEVQHDGKVGIGTASPDSNLEVESASDVSVKLDSANHSYLYIDRGSTSYNAEINFLTAGSEDWQFGTGLSGNDDKLGFRRASTDYLTLDESGKVGIGTTSPAELLHIEGASGLDGATPPTVKIHSTSAGTWTDNSTFARLAFGNEDTTGGISCSMEAYVDSTTGNNSGLRFLTSASANTPLERVRIDKDGKVGIGTTSPLKGLTVKATGNDDGIAVLASNGQYIALIHQQDTDAGMLRLYDASSTTKIVFNADDGESSYFNNDGKVGIGTASPSELLELAGSDVEIKLQQPDGQMGMRLRGDSNGGIINLSDSGGSTTAYLHGGGDSYFTGGNVGIGTATPDEQLTIAGADAQDAHFSMWGDRGDDSDDGIRFRVTNAGVLHIGTSKTAGLSGTPGWDERVSLIRGGNVGIGTTSPNDTLSVTGTAYADGGAGTGNTVFGYDAGTQLASGDNYNVFIGHQVADADMTNATNNVGIGYQALSALTEGDDNVVIGYQAGDAINTGVRNNLLGKDAGGTLTNGNDNVAIGVNALNNTTSVSNSISIGKSTCDAGLTADADGTVAIGYYALSALQSGAGNVAIGFESSHDCTTGVKNTSVGYQANDRVTGNGHNVAIGYQANRGYGFKNTVVGAESANYGASGSDLMTVIGYAAVQGNTTSGADYTVAVGASSLQALTSGANNVALGYLSGYALTVGGYNTALGTKALYSAVEDSYNVAVGYEALRNANGGGSDGSATATNNTAVGWKSGDVVTTGTANTLIGSNTDTSANSATNQTVIGSEVTGVADNSVTLGNADVTAVYMAQDSGATVYCGDINVQYHYIRAGINYDQSAGVFVVIPLNGGTRPFTTFTNGGESSTIIAPHDGSLEHIYVRSEEVAGNPVVVGFHKATNGTEVPSVIAVSTVSIDMSGIADDTSTRFAFTSNNTFSAGDVLGFSIDPANDINDCSFMITLKYDTTT